MVGQDQIIIITKQYETLRDLLNVGKEAIEQEIANKTPDTNFHEVEILSPVTKPARIICQGANYGAHREEAGLEAKRPPFNMIFTKANSALTGPTMLLLHQTLFNY